MTPSAVSDKDAVGRIVREAISSILPGLPVEDIAGNKSLRDLGADSVDRVEIILSVIRVLGVEEPMSNFSQIPNIDALVDYLWKVKQA